MFYERLHEALDLLVKFFHADERGLPMEMLRRQSFMNAEERLQYHKMDTTFLIDRYYQQRLLVCKARDVAEVNRRIERDYFLDLINLIQFEEDRQRVPYVLLSRINSTRSPTNTES